MNADNNSLVGKELRYLELEEKLVSERMEYLKDQLYRLQVEELTLMAMIRSKTVETTQKIISSPQCSKKDEKQNISDNEEILDLDVEKALQALALASDGLDIDVVEIEDD